MNDPRYNSTNDSAVARGKAAAFFLGLVFGALAGGMAVAAVLR